MKAEAVGLRVINSVTILKAANLTQTIGTLKKNDTKITKAN